MVCPIKMEVWKETSSPKVRDLIKILRNTVLNASITCHIFFFIFLTLNFNLQIAAEVAAPLSQCKKIVMVSNGKCDVGANKITTEILDIVANLPKSVEALTGIDISKVRK